MFELSFIKKYLTPKRRQLSVSLIALISVAMISLIVWLLVVFLSVTDGIEKNWTTKLTALNAPLRLTPTEEYFSSYYYKVDQFSQESHYTLKTIGQKGLASFADPYDPEYDETLPHHVPPPDLDANDHLKDPVQLAYQILDDLNLIYEDIEMSGALLRLEMVREQVGVMGGQPAQSTLTHVSYLASFAEKNPYLSQLLLAPSAKDIDHLHYLSGLDRANNTFYTSLLPNCDIETLKPKQAFWQIPLTLLPQSAVFKVNGYRQKDTFSHILIPTSLDAATNGTLEKTKEGLIFTDELGSSHVIDDLTVLCTQGDLALKVLANSDSNAFSVQTDLQKHPIVGHVQLDGLKIEQAKVKPSIRAETPLPWPVTSAETTVLSDWEGHAPILMAKAFKDNGVLLGDQGNIYYNATSVSGTQERKIPVYVAGFYDPGIMAVGNKCTLVPKEITRAIQSSDPSFALDRTEANALFVWLKNDSPVEEVKQALLERLEASGIGKYWQVQTYKEYEFAKDLMQQFESDKLLFSVVGIIILLVACTNIISLLIVLVSDKKKEIGILRAMGASRKSIATIFACTGASLGIIASAIGLGLGYLTIHHIDTVVALISKIQGHATFNAQFFGHHLPNTMSPKALLFVAIATPLLALLAGLFPAIKAARLNPCESLRSE